MVRYISPIERQKLQNMLLVGEVSPPENEATMMERLNETLAKMRDKAKGLTDRAEKLKNQSLIKAEDFTTKAEEFLKNSNETVREEVEEWSTKAKDAFEKSNKVVQTETEKVKPKAQSWLDTFNRGVTQLDELIPPDPFTMLAEKIGGEGTNPLDLAGRSMAEMLGLGGEASAAPPGLPPLPPNLVQDPIAQALQSQFFAGGKNPGMQSPEYSFPKTRQFSAPMSQISMAFPNLPEIPDFNAAREAMGKAEPDKVLWSDKDMQSHVLMGIAQAALQGDLSDMPTALLRAALGAMGGISSAQMEKRKVLEDRAVKEDEYQGKLAGFEGEVAQKDFSNQQAISNALLEQSAIQADLDKFNQSQFGVTSNGNNLIITRPGKNGEMEVEVIPTTPVGAGKDQSKNQKEEIQRMLKAHVAMNQGQDVVGALESGQLPNNVDPRLLGRVQNTVNTIRSSDTFQQEMENFLEQSQGMYGKVPNEMIAAKERQLIEDGLRSVPNSGYYEMMKALNDFNMLKVLAE